MARKDGCDVVPAFCTCAVFSSRHLRILQLAKLPPASAFVLPLPEARMLPPPHPQDQLHFIIQVPGSGFMSRPVRGLPSSACSKEPPSS